MPDIPHDDPRSLALRLREDGAPGAASHPAAARIRTWHAVLRPGDGQRIVRALEVLEASGRSIRNGRRARQPADRPQTAHVSSSSSRDRPHLVERIEARFDAHGRRRRDGRGEGAAGTGARPCAARHEGDRGARTGQVIEGRATLAAGDQKLRKIATRQYAKRQSTWFRHQLGPEWQRVASVYA